MTSIPAHDSALIGIRRDLHAHPELGFEEKRTSALVAANLRSWGVEVTEKVGITGVLGTIRGKYPGTRSIGLRADMDALPIGEETALPYASRTSGVMHACGHDGHTTMLLGAAQYLSQHRDFAGTVHLIFQPAEEGAGGAVAMMDDGLFERFPCDAIYGMHTGPGLPASVFATLPGTLMAGSGRFEVVFRGKGGHGGLSADASQDLALVQARFLVALDLYAQERKNAGEFVSVAVASLAGGKAQVYTVLPAEIRLQGTTRAFSDHVHGALQRELRAIAEAVGERSGAVTEVTTIMSTPSLVNAAPQTEIAVRAARATVGSQRVVTEGKPVSASEDFAFILGRRPGAFIFIGNGISADGSFHSIHTPQFDFNDAVIPAGVNYWINVVREELGPQSSLPQRQSTAQALALTTRDSPGRGC